VVVARTRSLHSLLIGGTRINRNISTHILDVTTDVAHVIAFCVLRPCITVCSDISDELPGADIDSDHNLLVAKVRTRLKKIIRFQKSRPRWDLEKLYIQRQRVQDNLEEKLGAFECESGNAEVQWKNI